MSIRNRNLILLSFVVSSVSFAQETSAPTVTETTVVGHGEEAEEVTAAQARELESQKAEIAKKEAELADLRKKNAELTELATYKSRMQGMDRRIESLELAIVATESKIELAKFESKKDGLKQVQVEVPKIVVDLLIAGSGPATAGVGFVTSLKAGRAIAASKVANANKTFGGNRDKLLRRLLMQGPASGTELLGGALVAGGSVVATKTVIPSIESLHKSKIGDGVWFSLGLLDSVQVRNLELELADLKKDLAEQKKNLAAEKRK